MMPNSQVCKFFLQGKCRYGDKCKNLHPAQTANQNTQRRPNQQNSTMCTFFQRGKCTKEDCSFLHGYGNELEHIWSEAHGTQIVSLIFISDGTFITAEERVIRYWTLQPSFKCIQEIPINEGKLYKLIYSGDKLIYILSKNSMISNVSEINVMTNLNNIIKCESSFEIVNDIIEVDNYIFCTGREKIEVFELKNNSTSIEKKCEIPLSNDDEIMTIKLFKTYFFCGHKNGKFSIWKPGQQQFLDCERSNTIDNECINKIAIKTCDESTHYLIITCGKNIKVFNIEKEFSLVTSVQVGERALDIYNTVNCEGQERFIVSLANGNLVILDGNLVMKYDIPTKANCQGLRIAIRQINPMKNENEGDLVVFTDGNMLDLYMWIKEGSFVVKKQGHKKNNYNRGQGGRGGSHQRGRGGYSKI